MMVNGIRSFINGVLVTVGLWGFTTGVVASQVFSLFLYPFSIKAYYDYLAHIMRQWSQNLFMTMKIFCPGDIIITFDASCVTDEEGEHFQDEGSEIERLLERNQRGEVVGISFPERLIMIANHQVKKKKKKKNYARSHNLISISFILSIYFYTCMIYCHLINN
jgi:hypothetical protein